MNYDETADFAPFPLGAPNASSALECLLHDLNQAAFDCATLGEADQLAARVLLEPKRMSERKTDVSRIATESFGISNATALSMCQAAKALENTGIEFWAAAMLGILDHHVGSPTWGLRKDRTFVRCVVKYVFPVSVLPTFAEIHAHSLLLRYKLMFHPSTPVKLVQVTFPGSGGSPESNPLESPRGLIARRRIEQDEFVLALGGLVSTDELEGCTQVSVVQHNGAPSVLVGPIRFVNHSGSRANCQVNQMEWRVRPYSSHPSSVAHQPQGPADDPPHVRLLPPGHTADRTERAHHVRLRSSVLGTVDAISDGSRRARQVHPATVRRCGCGRRSEHHVRAADKAAEKE